MAVTAAPAASAAPVAPSPAAPTAPAAPAVDPGKAPPAAATAPPAASVASGDQKPIPVTVPPQEAKKPQEPRLSPQIAAIARAEARLQAGRDENAKRKAQLDKEASDLAEAREIKAQLDAIGDDPIKALEFLTARKGVDYEKISEAIVKNGRPTANPADLIEQTKADLRKEFSDLLEKDRYDSRQRAAVEYVAAQKRNVHRYAEGLAADDPVKAALGTEEFENVMWQTIEGVVETQGREPTPSEIHENLKKYLLGLSEKFAGKPAAPTDATKTAPVPAPASAGAAPVAEAPKTEPAKMSRKERDQEKMKRALDKFNELEKSGSAFIEVGGPTASKKLSPRQQREDERAARAIAAAEKVQPK